MAPVKRNNLHQKDEKAILSKQAKERQRKAKLKLEESEEQKRLRQAKDRERKAKAKSVETIEQTKLRKEQNRERNVKARSQESEEQKAIRQRLDREAKLRARSQETEDQAAKRRLLDKDSKLQARSQETEDQADKRRLLDKDSKLQARSQETEEQTAQRRLLNKESMLQARSQETEEQAAQRRLLNKKSMLKARIMTKEIFLESLNDFADYECNNCAKRCYKNQVKKLKISNKQSILNEKYNWFLYKQFNKEVQVCHRCHTYLIKGALPPQSLDNNLMLPETPECIKNLTMMERHCLKRIKPHMKIIRLPGRFGQVGLRGQIILFAMCVEEVAEQLPLRPDECGIAIVTETLEGIKYRQELILDKQRLYTALNWLIGHNHLYRSVKVREEDTFNAEIASVVTVINETTQDATTDSLKSSYAAFLPCSKRTSDERLALCGTFNYTNDMFHGHNYKQSTFFSSLMAIFMSLIVVPGSWIKGIIDEILFHGDRVFSDHTKSINKCAKFDKFIALLPKEMSMRHQRFGWQESKQIKVNWSNMTQTLKEIFETENFVAIKIDDEFKTIIKIETRYLTFDAAPRTKFGSVSKNGAAIAILCQNLVSLEKSVKLPHKHNNNADITIYVIKAKRLETKSKCGVYNRTKKLPNQPSSPPRPPPPVPVQPAEPSAVRELKDHIHFQRASRRLNEDRFTVAASFDQSADIFEFAGLQCGAMSTVACAMSILLPLNTWSEETLNEVLIQGDIFYKYALHRNNLLEPRMLNAEEIQKTEQIKLRGVVFEIDLHLNDNLQIDSNEWVELPNFLQTIFQLSTTALFVAQSKIVALLTFNNRYLIFDSHSRNKQGMPSANGSAVLISCSSLKSLNDTLTNSFDIAGYFSIHPIRLINAGTDNIGYFVGCIVSFNNIVDFKTTDADYVAFEKSTKRKSDMRLSLLSKTHNNKNDVLKYADIQSSTIIVIGLVVHLLIANVNKWTKETLDQIIMTGEELFSKTLKQNKIICPRKLLLHELPKEIELNNINVRLKFFHRESAIEFSKKQMGLQLQIMFQNYNNIVLWFQGIYVLLFKADNKFVFFDCQPQSKTGNPTNIKNGKACVICCADLKSLISTIELSLRYIKTSTLSLIPVKAANAADIASQELIDDIDEDSDNEVTNSQMCRLFENFDVITSRVEFRLALQGSKHEGNLAIRLSKSGNRSYSISLYSLIYMVMINSVVNWTDSIVDNILKKAYKYHNKAKELQQPLYRWLEDKFNTKISLHKNDNEHNINMLGSVLENAFKTCNNFIITIAQPRKTKLNVAVSKFTTDSGNTTYTVFDCHARSQTGGPNYSGRGAATIVVCFSINHLSNTIKKSVNCKNTTTFSITFCEIAIENGKVDLDASTTSNGKESEVAEPEIIYEETHLIDTDTIRPLLEEVAMLPDDNDFDKPVNVVNLKRKIAPPVNTSKEKRAEEYCFFDLFPTGVNGFNENREIKLSALDYFQSRILSSDIRFHRNDYLFYALSMTEFENIKRSIGVCCRSIKQSATGINEVPATMVKNIHLWMRAIRGTTEYWKAYCADVIAMTRCLGTPTWFITLSCNDLGWDDIITACLIDSKSDKEIHTMTFNEKQKLIETNPVAVARQFMTRFRKLMNYLRSNDEILGGHIVDFSWRVEFQARGSPHIHMIIWCANIPAFDTSEGIELVDKVVTCGSMNEDDEMFELVRQIQTHRHSPTCYKNAANSQCRFGFPRPVSEETRFISEEDAVKNGGRFCILKRKRSEMFINNYCKDILEIWKGNMDIQPCVNSLVAYYVAKYIGKSEKKHISEALKEALKYGHGRKDIHEQMFCIAMKLFNMRELSSNEAAFRMCRLVLRSNSRKTVFINNRPAQERFRLLKQEVLSKQNNERNDDSSEQYFCQGIIEKYTFRPDDMERVSLAEFAVNYEPYYENKLNEEDNDIDADAVLNDMQDDLQETVKIIKLKNGNKMKKRKRPAILKTVYCSPESNRELYYFGQLLLHLPFREEIKLTNNFRDAEEAFFQQRLQLRPLQSDYVSLDEFRLQELELHRLIAHMTIIREEDDGEEAANEAEQVDNVDLDQNLPHQDDEDYEQIIADPTKRELMTEKSYQDLLKLLNSGQKNVVELVKTQLRNKMTNRDITPLKVFVTGSGGTGKSLVLKACVETIQRGTGINLNFANPNQSTVEIAALTGKSIL